MQSASRATIRCLSRGSTLCALSKRTSDEARLEIRFASTARASAQPGRRPPRPLRALSVVIAVGGVSLLALPLYIALVPRHPSLQPQAYCDLTVYSTERLTPQHALLGLPIPPGSRALFGADAVRHDRSRPEDGEIVIQHMYVKNPDLMIERPYTPVNNVARDGVAKIVVKKVEGGEVGRHIHGLKAGDHIGIRGPVVTFTLQPSKYDKIVMISTGTGIAPFLQLLDKLPALPPTTKLHLLHASPKPDRQDWAVTSGLLPRLQQRYGNQLVVDRIPSGPVSKSAVETALQGVPTDKTMVFVCLPPHLLGPVAGQIAPNLGQGPLTGILADLGLAPSNVCKLA